MRGTTITRARGRAACAAVAALALALTAAAASAQAANESRSLSFYNVNTKETLTVAYKKDGRFVPDAMRRINHMMRDWRRNEATRMDPELIDLIWELHAELGSEEPIHLISGYRSQRTNAALRSRGGGQAQQSRHVTGEAADVHFPDVTVRQLRNSALVRERGGVGYYPGSNIPFVHVDTGRVRHWPRLPRQELAELFPSGRTRHVPADGRPLTARDGQLALARLRARGEAPGVQVASAARTPPAQRERDRPADQEPSQAKPLAVAALTPPQRPSDAAQSGQRPASRLPWHDPSAAPAGHEPPATTEVTAPPDEPPGLQLATVDLGLTAAFEGVDGRGLSPSPRRPVATAGAAAAEEPDTLSYSPYPVLALMTESRQAPRHALMELAHPRQEQVGALLPVAETAVAVRFEHGAGAMARTAGPRFTGPAVPDILAALPKATPPRAKLL